MAAIAQSLVALVLIFAAAAPSRAQLCSEEQAGSCHWLAWCEAERCGCFSGFFDDSPPGMRGRICNSEVGAVSFSFRIGASWDADISGGRLMTSHVLDAVSSDILHNVLNGSKPDEGYSESFSYTISGDGNSTWFSAHIIVRNLTMAEQLVSKLKMENPAFMDGTLRVTHGLTIYGLTLQHDRPFKDGYMPAPPTALAMKAATTQEDPIVPLSTGLFVTDVQFNRACLHTGCWVVDVVHSGLQYYDSASLYSFYLPRARFEGGATGVEPPFHDPGLEKSFDVLEFPCRTHDEAFFGEGVQTRLSACCIPLFLEHYRAVKSFGYDPASYPSNFTSLFQDCWAPGNFVDAGDFDYVHPAPPIISRESLPSSGLSGWFSGPGMEASFVTYAGVLDPNLGLASSRFFLDASELRQFAGKASGLNEAVDTFIGVVDLRVTDTVVLDSYAIQVGVAVQQQPTFVAAVHGHREGFNLRVKHARLLGSSHAAQFIRPDLSFASLFIALRISVAWQPESEFAYVVPSIPSDSIRVGKSHSDNPPLHMEYFCSQNVDPAVLGLLQGCPSATLCQGEFPAQTSHDTADSTDGIIDLNIPVGVDYFSPASLGGIPEVHVQFMITLDHIDADGNPLPEIMQSRVSVSVQIPMEEIMESDCNSTDPDPEPECPEPETWGHSQYASCTLEMSWQDLDPFLRRPDPSAWTGGLGRLLQYPTYGVWMCLANYECGGSADGIFCWVYNEQSRDFEPW